jgi:hypothetical protein
VSFRSCSGMISSIEVSARSKILKISIMDIMVVLCYRVAFKLWIQWMTDVNQQKREGRNTRNNRFFYRRSHEPRTQVEGCFDCHACARRGSESLIHSRSWFDSIVAPLYRWWWVLDHRYTSTLLIIQTLLAPTHRTKTFTWYLQNRRKKTTKTTWRLLPHTERCMKRKMMVV